jgi:hypothetical protein
MCIRNILLLPAQAAAPSPLPTAAPSLAPV